MRRDELDRPFFDMSQADTEERNYLDIAFSFRPTGVLQGGDHGPATCHFSRLAHDGARRPVAGTSGQEIPGQGAQGGRKPGQAGVRLRGRRHRAVSRRRRVRRRPVRGRTQGSHEQGLRSRAPERLGPGGAHQGSGDRRRGGRGAVHHAGHAAVRPAGRRPANAPASNPTTTGWPSSVRTPPSGCTASA